MFVYVVAAGSAFVAVFAFALWALEGLRRPADARLRSLVVERRQGGEPSSLPFAQRVIAPAIDGFGRRLEALLPGAFIQRTERRLITAGEPLRTDAFLTLVIACAGACGAAYVVLLLAMTGGAPPVAALLAAPVFATLGAVLPILWLSSRAKARQRAVLRSLPDSLGLLTVCVEAGLGLDGAFAQVMEKQPGPLSAEIRRTLQEMGVGKARRQALLDMAERMDLDDVRIFTSAVIQADQLGTSLAQALRVQSQSMRVRQRQRIEQEARRAPVKMVFPLVFCLMPSLFIFILGPIIVTVIEFISS